MIRRVDIRPNGIILTHWVDKKVEYRSNILVKPGQRIDFHTHRGDHQMEVTHGTCLLEMYEPDQRGFTSQILEEGDKVDVPAGWKHSVVSMTKEGKQLWEVICSWPEGRIM